MAPRRGSAEEKIKRGLLGTAAPGGSMPPRKAMSQAGARAAIPRIQYRSGL
jgi:hypothetical protein